jgi:putative lipoic acid-binding regulatory protein
MNTFKNEKLEYPRTWEFCVIGKDKDKLKNAIKECIPNGFDHRDSKSHKSYHSQKIKTQVSSQEERDELFKRLQNHPEITYIL